MNTNEPEKPARGTPWTEDIPILPFDPDSIKKRSFYTIEAGDLKTDQDVEAIIRLLWEQPETEVRYYHPHNSGVAVDGALLAARNRGDILMDDMDRRYYKHPNFKRDYLRIVPKGDVYAWAWEKEVVEKGPEFWQVKLKLSQRKRDELDAWRKVQLEEQLRQQARQARYSHDVFLSYANADRDEAQSIHDQIVAGGHKVFMAQKGLTAGDDFAEKIRLSLLSSREVWVLISPNSAKSEWVTTEWGAAWALGKLIIPILHRCAPESLPDRLRSKQCIDLHRVGEPIARLTRPATA